MSKWLKSSNIKINQKNVKNSKLIKKTEDTQEPQSQFIHVNYEDKITPENKVDSDFFHMPKSKNKSIAIDAIKLALLLDACVIDEIRKPVPWTPAQHSELDLSMIFLNMLEHESSRY